jgi:hypothetical protein
MESLTADRVSKRVVTASEGASTVIMAGKLEGGPGSSNGMKFLAKGGHAASHDIAKWPRFGRF